MKICKSFNKVQILFLIFFISTISVLCVEEVYADECGEVLTLINKERESHSVKPLKVDKNLEKAAGIRCREIITMMSHTRPDGSRFSTVSPKAKGENLAAGHKTPEEVVTAWMESPGHKKNILNPTFTTVGISYTKTDSGYKNYWVNLFGRCKEDNKVSLEKVSGVKTESKKNQVTLRWKKQTPTQVTGFEVFKFRPKTKEYKLLVKIPKPSANGLVIKGLKSSTTYKYQIRSYKVVNNKTYYTSPFKITTKTKSV